MSVEQVSFNLSGPIELSPGPGRTRAGSLQNFIGYVSDLGGDPRAIMERFDIDPLRACDPEHHIASRAMVEMFQYCASTLDAPLFGFHLAEMQTPEVFGCVAALCRAAPDLHVAVRNFMDYLPLVHSPEYEVAICVGEQTIELRWFHHSDDYGAYEQANHHAMHRIVNLFRSLAPSDFRLRYANISTGIPTGFREELEYKVGGPVHYNQDTDSIGISASAFARPLASSNRVVHHLLDTYLGRVRAAQRLSLRERVEAYVRGAMASGNCSVAGCARQIGISTRTLQHQLRSAHVSFSEIAGRQRMERAKAYLIEGNLSASEIALRLGYAEQTSFGRAFRKWTGHSPGHFRK